MNWGKGLIIGMSSFMLFITVLVITMFGQPDDDYDRQYYEKGLAFNTEYNMEKQTIDDNARPFIKVAGGEIKVTFAMPAKGIVVFSRPSDSNLDRRYVLNTGMGTVTDLPAGKLKAGQWHISIRWESQNKQYLYNQKIFLP